MMGQLADSCDSRWLAFHHRAFESVAVALHNCAVVQARDSLAVAHLVVVEVALRLVVAALEQLELEADNRLVPAPLVAVSALNICLQNREELYVV
jgi:hypothetical protein